MKQTFKMVFSVLLFSIMCLNGFAQNANDKVTITGKVVDKDGLGVVGLNVVEKGTKNGVLTDFDGAYKIQARKGAVLQFSYIGMKTQEKTVGTATSINVTILDDNSTLNEVVVVGYGTQKKENLTGAVQTIKMDRIADLPVTNLAESLRGQIPGVSVGSGGANRPGQTADITIRQTFGLSSDGSTNFPLIVIDDMVQIDPATGKSSMDMFNRLDPSEIESITILKDGSAAIYGSRASQGAILVKTKRGKEGKTQLSYSSQFSINDAISHGKTMSAYESGLYNNRLLKSLSPTIVDGLLYSDAELAEMKGLDYNWLKKAWKPATQQKHTLNVSGGTDKATYFAGLTYLTEGANLGSQDFKRWNFRTGVNAKVTKDLDLSFSVSGNSGDIEKSFTKSSSSVRNYGAAAGEQADYSLLLHMPKFVSITLTKGGVEYYTSPFPSSQSNLSNTQNSNTSISGWNYFATLNNGSKSLNTDFTYNVNGSLTYKVPFIKGLSLRGSYARSQTASRAEQVALPYTLARITNFYTAGNHLASEASDSEINIAENTKSVRVQYDNNISKNMQANFFASYARTFGDHDLDAMVGVERSENEYFQTRLLYDTTTTKDYLGTSTTAGTLNAGNSYSVKGEGGTLSYLGRLNYSYKSKYLLQFIFREDASTKFAPENYWGFFPSFQGGWIVSKENWFADNVSWINFLKLRYSVGKTGRDNIKPWRWDTYFDLATDKGEQFGTNGGTLATAILPRPNPNRNAHWDTDWKQDFGIDMNLLKNRLQITADYYFDKNTDMLIPLTGQVGVPLSVGGAFAEENYAAVNAWGSELSINWSDKVKDNFSYNVGVNFSYNNNEIKKYTDPGYALESTNTKREGSSYSYFPVWGFKVWKGTSTGDGILRTDEDVHNYWQYLTNQATASGVVGAVPQYFDIKTEAELLTKKGTLAYQDLGGALDTTTGLQKSPDGKINKNEDYGKLAKSNRTYGFTTNLGAKYKGFYIKSQIATSWGGYNSVDLIPEFTKASTNSSEVTFARESFWKDMYGYDNLNGKYPSTAFKDYTTGVPSDFWSLNTFRCTVRNLSAGFEIPKEVLKTINIDKLSIGITGYNLWDLYNPYPDHYRNMYDDSSTGYPTLRSWTVNLNVTF